MSFQPLFQHSLLVPFGKSFKVIVMKKIMVLALFIVTGGSLALAGERVPPAEVVGALVEQKRPLFPSFGSAFRAEPSAGESNIITVKVESLRKGGLNKKLDDWGIITPKTEVALGVNFEQVKESACGKTTVAENTNRKSHGHFPTITIYLKRRFPVRRLRLSRGTLSRPR